MSGGCRGMNCEAALSVTVRKRSQPAENISSSHKQYYAFMTNKYLHSFLHCNRVTALLEYLNLGMQIAFGQGSRTPPSWTRRIFHQNFYWTFVTFPIEKGNNNNPKPTMKYHRRFQIHNANSTIVGELTSYV